VNGGHGSNLAIGTMMNGIGISMKKLKTMEIMPNGQSAKLAVGWTSGDLVNELYKIRKYTGMTNQRISKLLIH
jgi:hypothetical protein